MMVDLQAILRSFVELQAQLVIELKRVLGPRDWRYLTNVPRRGEMEVSGTRWVYEVHGTGVRFFSDHGVVDMNRNFDGDPRSFDAGRLVEYLSSIGLNSVTWAERVIEFDHERGPSILRELQAAGAIQRVEPRDGELYTLPT